VNSAARPSAAPPATPDLVSILTAVSDRQPAESVPQMEGGGTRPTLETLEKLAVAVGAELVVGVGEHLSENRSIAKLVREGRAVVRRAS